MKDSRSIVTERKAKILKTARKARFVLWMFWEEYGETESLDNTASIGSGWYR
jgi:hypothetical protein